MDFSRTCFLSKHYQEVKSRIGIGNQCDVTEHLILSSSYHIISYHIISYCHFEGEEEYATSAVR